MSEIDHRLYELEVSVEASTLYHEWRRSSLESWARWIRVIALVGSALSLLFAFASPVFFQPLIMGASVLAAVATLFDLVFGIDEKARQHADLYQRFKRLQVEMASQRDQWERRLNNWDAAAKEIRVDEPPVYWGLYAEGWNQVLSKKGVESGDLRLIGPVRRFLRNVLPFSPNDFPLRRSTSSSA